MGQHLLERTLILPHPRETVFAFFSRPENLEEITPPWLRFRIVTPLPIAMREGTVIRYRLRIKGIPLTWVSKITGWDPPHRFVDEQITGPYRQWIHEHVFEEVEGGTMVRDRVRYAVPGGALVNRFLVRPDVEKIFDYRRERLLARFAGAGSPEARKRS